MLLGPVVQVALQAASLRVLRLDQPAARGLELVGACLEVVVTVLQLGPQPHQPQHQTGLGREVGEQPFLHGCERQARPLLEPELTEYPVAVQDRQCAQALRTDREPVRCRVASCRPRHAGRPASGHGQAAGHQEPDLRPLSARALGEQSRHAGREILGAVVADALGEPGQDVVRRRHAGGWPVRARPAPARTRGRPPWWRARTEPELGESVRPISTPPPSTTST